MAAGGVQPPAVIQGGNLRSHDCVLNIDWFMISKGGRGISFSVGLHNVMRPGMYSLTHVLIPPKRVTLLLTPVCVLTRVVEGRN